VYIIIILVTGGNYSLHKCDYVFQFNSETKADDILALALKLNSRLLTRAEQVKFHAYKI